MVLIIKHLNSFVFSNYMSESVRSMAKFRISNDFSNYLNCKNFYALSQKCLINKLKSDLKVNDKGPFYYSDFLRSNKIKSYKKYTLCKDLKPLILVR